MKKIIIASIMAIAATVASAGSATIEYQSGAGRQGSLGNSALALTVRENVTQAVQLDVGFTNTQTSGTMAVGTQVEVGATYSLPIRMVTASTRIAVGQYGASGSSDSYWSIEPGVSYAVNKNVNVAASYEFSTAMDSAAVAATVRTARVGVSYAFNKNDAVGIRYDHVRGDSQLNVVALNYTRSF